MLQITSWKKELSIDEIEYIRNIQADTNVKRMFLYMLLLFGIQICNLIVDRTVISRYKSYYDMTSLYTMGICIIYFNIALVSLYKCPENLTVRRKRILYFGFWYIVSIICVAFNLGDMLDRRSINNFIYFLAAVSIIPIFNISELGLLLCVAIGIQACLVIFCHLPIILLIQSIGLCVFAIATNQMLFLSFVSTHISKKRLQISAETDMLTNLLNRWGLEKWIVDNFDDCVIHQYNVILGVVDIDFFKFYNDKYGHASGDTCLKMIAGCIKDVFSDPNHTVCRYGGEEFVVVVINECFADTMCQRTTSQN